MDQAPETTPRWEELLPSHCPKCGMLLVIRDERGGFCGEGGCGRWTVPDLADRLREKVQALETDKAKAEQDASNATALLNAAVAKRYDVRELIRRAEEAESSSARMKAIGEKDIDDLLNLVIWMSGSGDFGPEAPAGKIWAEFRDKIVRPIMQRRVEELGARAGPLLSSWQEEVSQHG